MAEPIVGAVAASVEHREAESLEFPGCRPVRITRDEIAVRDLLDPRLIGGAGRLGAQEARSV